VSDSFGDKVGSGSRGGGRWRRTGGSPAEGKK